MQIEHTPRTSQKLGVCGDDRPQLSAVQLRLRGFVVMYTMNNHTTVM